VLDRSAVRDEARALSPQERRVLKGLGVRLTGFSIYLPTLLKPLARQLARGFLESSWHPPTDRLSPLPRDRLDPKALSAHGLRAVGGWAVPVADLDRLEDLLRTAPRRGQGAVVGPDILSRLGWSETAMRDILRGLNFAPTDKPKPGEPMAWRPRALTKVPAPAAAKPGSPFAALEVLKVPPAPARRPRRRRRSKAASA